MSTTSETQSTDKGCCLGTLCHISNTLYAQHHSSTAISACYISRTTLLRCWGKQQHYLHLGLVLSIKHSLVKIQQLIKLIGVVVFPPLSGNTHIGFVNSVLSCFRQEIGFQSVRTADIDWKHCKKTKYATTTQLKQILKVLKE